MSRLGRAASTRRRPKPQLGIVPALVALSFVVLTGITPGASQEGVDSDSACIQCHQSTTHGIVEQFKGSSMASSGVACGDCHTVTGDYAGAQEHMGGWILASPTPAICGKCHPDQIAQFIQSRHSAPAYAAMLGTEEFTAEQMAVYEAIPEGSYRPDKLRSALYSIEGEDITRFACHRCHDIGKPQPDGSIGQCQKCHLRHTFSLEQARKPETCNACHIGPDHPQWEIYQESPHGICYMTMGDNWNWEKEPGTLTVNDFPAPVCVTCHMSGFGGAATTHDVGDRLSWYLFAPISERRPSWEENKARMQEICGECHSASFVADFYAGADKVVEAVSAQVRESDTVWKDLTDAGLTTPEPFDRPIDFIYFDLWHHWGRTAKFGAWMQGADYVQWHGEYEILRELNELKSYAEENK